MNGKRVLSVVVTTDVCSLFCLTAFNFTGQILGHLSTHSNLNYWLTDNESEKTQSKFEEFQVLANSICMNHVVPYWAKIFIYTFLSLSKCLILVFSVFSRVNAIGIAVCHSNNKFPC